MENTVVAGRTGALVDIREVAVDKELSREERIGYRLRIASPHHSPAYAAALPEQAHAAGTLPKSLGSRA